MCENVSPLFLTPLERFLTPLSTAVDTWTHAIPLLLLLLLTLVKGAAEIDVFPLSTKWTAVANRRHFRKVDPIFPFVLHRC